MKIQKIFKKNQRNPKKKIRKIPENLIKISKKIPKISEIQNEN